MNQLFITILTIVGSILASGGFWAWFQKRSDKKDARTKMLFGIGHDRLVHLSLLYIDRGSITKEEYENLHDYLYIPYKELKGNGVVSKLMEEVKKLPIRSSIYPSKKEQNT